MALRLLDTCKLINHWHHRWVGRLADRSEVEAIQLAQELVKLERTDAIVTPVYMEFIAGARSTHELRLAEAYLSEFRILDKGRIPKEDWDDALRRAQRVPRNGKPRDAVDCLIAAIAKRLRYEVVTADESFPK